MRISFRSLLLLIFSLLLLSIISTTHNNPMLKRTKAAIAAKPNIVLLLTDDQDSLLGSLDYMPQVKKLLTEQGVSFSNYTVPTPLCCPSRMTLLRGQYAHNHGVLTNRPETGGGYETAFALGVEQQTLATVLQAAGYQTAIFGKYLNGYPFNDPNTPLPPGWNKRIIGNDPRGFRYVLNEDGQVKRYNAVPQEHFTDVLAVKVNQFIQNQASKHEPFFVYLAPAAPHDPAVPAPRHQNLFSAVQIPRTPSFNESDVSDKPLALGLRTAPQLDDSQIIAQDMAFRNRLRSLQAVDDMVGTLVATLQATGQLSNTYIIFTSDNGYHFGQHRQNKGKNHPYEEDLIVPLIIRGPGISTGQTITKLVSEIDLAVTIADLAGTQMPAFVDGRSLRPLWSSQPPEQWRNALLFERMETNFAHPMLSTALADSAELENPQEESVITESSIVSGATTMLLSTVLTGAVTSTVEGRTVVYAGIRTSRLKYVAYYNGECEFYNLLQDPYELENRCLSLSPVARQQWLTRLQALTNCQADGCRAIEDAPTPAEADLSLTIQSTPTQIAVGQTMTYQVTMRNQGPDIAENALVMARLPTTATLISAGSECSSVGDAITCQLGDLHPDNEQRLQFVVQPTLGKLLYTAITAWTDTTDPIATNNSVAVTTSVTAKVDLTLDQSLPITSVNLGDDITYTFTVTNAGPDIAPEVQLTNTLPPALTLLRASSSCGSHANAVICALGDLTLDTSQTLTMMVRAIDHGTFSNTITVLSLGVDQNVNDNQQQALTKIKFVPTANLAITLSNSSPVYAEGILTYTIRVSNTGVIQAKDIVIHDSLPVSVTILSAPLCEHTRNSVTCVIPALDPGQSEERLFVLRPLVPGLLANEATVASRTRDPILSNKRVQSTIEALAAADLSLQMTTMPTLPQRGENLTYTLTIYNNGPNRAHQLSIADELSADVRFLFASPECTQSNGLVTCVVEAIGNQSSKSIFLTVRSKIIGTLINSATLQSGVFDPDLSNNTQTVQTVVSPRPPALITFRLESTPKSSDNVKFVGDRTFVLDDPVVDDGDAFHNERTVKVGAGKFTFSGKTVSGWAIAKIACDPMTKAEIDLSKHQVIITVAASEAVTCTFFVTDAPS